MAQIDFTRSYSIDFFVAQCRLGRMKGYFVMVIMQALLSIVHRFFSSEDGPTAVEYAVMLALIIVVCLAAITTIGSNASSVFSGVANSL